MRKIKVCIADDHTLFRKAMVNLLQSFDRVESVKDAENGRMLLGMVKGDIPDVSIVDLQMPVMDGVETCEHLISKYPDMKIIVLLRNPVDRAYSHWNMQKQRPNLWRW